LPLHCWHLTFSWLCPRSVISWTLPKFVGIFNPVTSLLFIKIISVY
jgi:hypothetical protein